jgi:hypothetical protein
MEASSGAAQVWLPDELAQQGEPESVFVHPPPSTLARRHWQSNTLYEKTSKHDAM